MRNPLRRMVGRVRTAARDLLSWLWPRPEPDPEALAAYETLPELADWPVDSVPLTRRPLGTATDAECEDMPRNEIVEETPLVSSAAFFGGDLDEAEPEQGDQIGPQKVEAEPMSAYLTASSAVSADDRDPDEGELEEPEPEPEPALALTPKPDPESEPVSAPVSGPEPEAEEASAAEAGPASEPESARVVERRAGADAALEPAPVGERLAAAESAPQRAAELSGAVDAVVREAADAAEAREAKEAREVAEGETGSVALPPPRPVIDVPRDYVPAAESGHEIYQVDVDAFEGPLDLLLHLIRRHQIDILDIPIGFICERYLGCLKVMEELNIDVAAEFMYLASELLHIKSKMLIPRPQDVNDQDDEEDPRAELVRRLLEYQKYKEAAEVLGGFNWLGREVFDRRAEKLPTPEGAPAWREMSIFALVDAFHEVLKRQKPELRHQVVAEQVSVRRRMLLLIDQLHGRGSLTFQQAVGAAAGRLQLIATFLAVLELVRLQLLSVYESPEGNLYLRGRFDRTEEATARLEGRVPTEACAG